MTDSATRVTAFVLDRLSSEPVATRVTILRDLANISPLPDEAKRIRTLADELEDAERRHRQLVLDFKRAAL